METSEDIKAAKEAIQALLKAKKAVRMYPGNNPIYRKTVEDTLSKFSDVFDFRDDFNLRIRQNEILFDSEQIYFNPEKEDNLALFFFKDGLRELTFRKGLSQEELEEFLKIVALDFDREAVDDDVVTLFWERDFENIRYVADETLLTEDEDYETKAVKDVKDKAAGTDEVLKAYAEAFESEDVKEISIVNLTDKDLQALVKEMEKDHRDKTGRIYDILIEMLAQSESTVEYEDVQRLLKEVFFYCYKRGELALIVGILKKTKKLAEDASMSDDFRRQMKLLLSSVNSEESVKSVGAIFDSETDIDEDLLSEYTDFLDTKAIAPFLSVLGGLESTQGRKIVTAILAQLGRRDMHSIAKGLNDSRWHVVKSVIHILRSIGDKKAVEYLLNSVKHKDDRVRKEAISTLGELKSPLALQTLKECLGDPDVSIRKSAVKALGTIGSETAKRIILEKVAGKEFGERAFDEKKEFYETLAHWSDEELTSFMMKVLKKRTFFGGAKASENKACAAYYLGLIGYKDALPALYTLSDSSNRIVKEYADAAIKRIG